MMAKKIRVAVLFGGRSAEHEVSLQSAKSVIDAIDKTKYDVTMIGIDKHGRWYLNDESKALLTTENPKLLNLNKANNAVALVPWGESQQLIPASEEQDKVPPQQKKIDVVFPVLHGPFGEDGTMQGLLKLANLPFVGPSVLGSAVGMDKDVAKRLLRDAGINIARFVCFKKNERKKIKFADVSRELGIPLFVKPANLGSSVGVKKANNESEFNEAIDHAFKFDTKIIVEEFIKGREIECAVLGNAEPKASIPGEIVPQHDFYSYEAKYIDEHGAKLEMPAKLSDAMTKEVQETAVKTFQTLCCEGMARVDFFLSEERGLLVNEINTIPGFTKISMYPKLWELSGLSFTELVNRLIELAIERFEDEQALRTTRDFEGPDEEQARSEAPKQISPPLSPLR
jgi:D-alanine-D-alanine ligase